MKPLPGPASPSDAELRQLIAEHVKGLTIDESKIRKHVFRPPNTVGVFSDRGPEESKLRFAPRPPIGVLPYYLNVGAFGAALHNALKDNVAGYAVQLRQQGQAIFTKE